MRQERKKRVAVPETLRVRAEMDAAENSLDNENVCLGTEGNKNKVSVSRGAAMAANRQQYGNGRKRQGSKNEFFQCILDWIKTVQTLPRGYVTILQVEEKPVSAMWLCYSQNPVLDCSTDIGIEEILMDMMFYRKICLAA